MSYIGNVYTMHCPATVETPDGTATLITADDVIELASKYVSHEYGDYLIDLMADIKDTQDCAYNAMKDEYDGMEQTLDSYTTIMRDAADDIEEIMNDLSDSRRINKSKLLERLLSIYTSINSEI
jgi:dGTP triphosphohydrolase